MANTPQQILDQILLLKESNINLSGLTSTSEYSKFKNIYATIATELSIFEQYMDNFILDMEYQKETTPLYTPAWWNDRMINFFQYNVDPDKGVLKINDQFQMYYEVEDEISKIIEFSATRQSEGSRQVTIKVAKNDGNDFPEVLTNDEILAASSFISNIKAAGTLINVVSFPADKIKLNINIYFDGQYILSDVQDDCKNAIKQYFKTLEFDGDIRLQKIVDAIQSVPGVKDLEVISAFGQPDGGNYEQFTRVFPTKSGYAILDEPNTLLNLIIE